MQIVITSESLKRIKNATRVLAPDVASGHLTEAIAAGCHFRIDAALKSALDRDGRLSVRIDDSAAISRLKSLGVRACRPDILSASVRACGLADEIPTMLDRIKLPPSSWLAGYDGAEFDHPFPPELSRHPIFKVMRETWDLKAFSTRDRAFLVPPPPASVFDLECYQDKEVYCNWPANKEGPIHNGCIGAVVKNRYGKPCGILMWSWWSTPVAGTDFWIIAPDQGEFVETSFDMRPYKTMPDGAPAIRPDDLLGFKGAVAQIRGIAPQHPYGEEWIL